MCFSRIEHDDSVMRGYATKYAREGTATCLRILHIPKVRGEPAWPVVKCCTSQICHIYPASSSSIDAVASDAASVSAVSDIGGCVV